MSFGTPSAQYQGIYSRRPRFSDIGDILFIETFQNSHVGMYNDAAGAASRDCEISFGGFPSVRLSTLGSSAGAIANPQDSPNTNGVVFKRRIEDLVNVPGFGGIYEWEGWFRWTSLNNSTNALASFSIYNRDGTNAYLGRVWFDSTVNPVTINILQSNGTWATIGTSNVDVANHLYDLSSGGSQADKAGMWNYFRLVVDLQNLVYVEIQLNDKVIPNTSAIRTIVTGGAKAMHFSVEYAAKTATARYMNVARLVARRLRVIT